MRFLPAFLLMCFCAAWLRPCEAQTLAQLEAWAAQNAIDNQLAQADINVLEQRLRISQAQQGARVFGSANLAHNRDVVSSTGTVSYQDANAQIGIRLPLLGSALKQAQDVQEAGLALRLARLRREQTRSAVIRLLRLANAELYFSEQRIALGQAFLRVEPQARGILQKREQAHLLLTSDALDFLSMFDLARRDLQRDEATKQSAQFVLTALTGHPVTDYVPRAPSTALSVSARARVLQEGDDAPAVQMARAVLEQRRADLLDARWAGIDAYLTIAQGGSHGIGVPSGASTSVGIEVNMPLDLARERDALRAQEQARIQQAQVSLQQAQEKEIQQRQLAISTLDVRAQDLDSSRRQLQAAYAAWWVAHQRAKSLDGDVLERELQKRYALYQASMAYSRSLQLAAQGVIDALSFCSTETCAQIEDGGPRELNRPQRGVSAPSSANPVDPFSNDLPTTAPVGTRSGLRLSLALQNVHPVPSIWDALATFDSDWFAHARQALSCSLPVRHRTGPQSTGLGWYVWDGWALLDRHDPLSAFPAATLRLYVSFTAAQLQRLMTSASTAQRLRDFIAKAHARGMAVDWLLGDPTLALSSGQSALSLWLPIMQTMGFDGINLDAEPSQLPPDQRSLWQEGIITTVTLLRSSSAWPITLTINWRDLNQRLAQDLRESGLSRAAVMIYVRNPDRSMTLASQVLQEAPDLPMTLVQSVEPGLSDAESTWSLGQRGSMRQWHSLDQHLRVWPNFRGIDVQSWGDFQEAKP